MDLCFCSKVSVITLFDTPEEGVVGQRTIFPSTYLVNHKLEQNVQTRGMASITWNEGFDFQ